MAVSGPENLDNLFSLYESAGNLHGSVAVLNYERFKIVHTEGSAWPNICFGIAGGHFDEAVVEEITKEMAARGMRPTIILPNDQTQAGLLKKNGYFPVDQWQGMSYTIGSDLQEGLTREVDDEGCSLVSDPGETAKWVEVVSETLFDNRPVDPGIFTGLRSRGAMLVGVTVEGSLAGSSMVYFDSRGVAGIYMVGVRMAYRKMGLGKKVIGYCRSQIKERGVKECCLQSTRMGTGLYRAMGFKESDKYLIYCKIK